MNTLITIFAIAALNFSHLSIKDGLTAGSVTDIWFDTNGTTWIATGYGLNRYDGNEVCRYVFDDEVRSNSVMRVCGDSEGTIFVACKSELYSIDQRTDKIQTILKENFRAIVWANGALYAACDNIVRKYTGSEFETIFTLAGYEKISAMFTADGNDIWLGTFSGKVFRYSRDTGRLFSWTVGSMIENLYHDSQGNIWVASMENGLQRIDPWGTMTYVPVSSDFVRTMCEDSLGNLWVGTFTGLDCLAPDGSVSHYTNRHLREESLSNNSVWVIRRDFQGTMWVGTFFGGVNLCNPELDIYSKYPVSDRESEGLSSSITSRICEESDGTLWVATEGGGLNRLDATTGKYTWYYKGGINSLTENNIKDMFLDSGNGVLWVGTHLGGLNKINLRNGRSVPFAQSSNPDFLDVLCVSDYGDSLLVGTEKVLLCVSKTTGEQRVVEPRRVAFILPEDDGSFWYSSQGLYKSTPGCNYSDLHLSVRGINSMCKDGEGRIWLGSSKRGLDIYDPKDSSSFFLDLSYIWPEDERPMGLEYSPFSGRMLVTSSSGLSIIDPVSLKLEYINKTSGFPLYQPVSVTATTDGTVFVGGVDGLVSFDENAIQTTGKPYELFFTKLTIDGEEQAPCTKVMDVNLPYCKSVVIPPKSVSFSVGFSSTKWRSGMNNALEYRLEGFSKNWIRVGTTSELFFYNISHGRYVLRLRPSDSSDFCEEASLVIRVMPRWFQTLAAKLFFILTVMALLILCVRYFKRYFNERESVRLRQLQAKDSEKFRIFEMATAVVYHNLDNADFEVATFAKEMALSRTALFEKLKYATGKTPHEFVLNIRLKEGADLLRNNMELNVGEIADRVGFSSSRYFAKCFKDCYGKTPVEYRQSC